MSSELARREKTPQVPGCPESQKQLREEIFDLAYGLMVVDRLRAYGAALRLFDTNEVPGGKFWLLELDIPKSELSIVSYSNIAEANEGYADIESSAGSTRDAVLVSVDSLAALKRAYPNYFLDTTKFLGMVQSVIDGK
jgi:hypothetical protein